MRAKILGSALVALLLTASAYADVIFMLGNPGHQPGEENILFHTAMTGNPIFGFTNISNAPVEFSSTMDTLRASGGQSDIDAVDGFVNDIMVTTPGHTFKDLIFNPFKDVANEDLHITVVANDGIYPMPPPFTYGKMNGQNFLFVNATGSTLIKSVDIFSDFGFDDLRQIRISGVEVIPEPSSMLLLGSGVLLFAQGLRRKLM